MNEKKELRKELEKEFCCLKEFGVTEIELEYIYETCGLKPIYSMFLKINKNKLKNILEDK